MCAMLHLPTVPQPLAAAWSNSTFNLVRHYAPENFTDQFFFRSGSNDPSLGFVNYLGYRDAHETGLVGVVNNKFYVGVDFTTTLSVNASKGRNSVRLESKESFNHGLLIADIAHMPGDQCGVWSSLWTFNFEEEPYGEIDIIEGTNHQTTNSVSLHTCGKCSFSSNTTRMRTDCDMHADQDCEHGTNANGCGVRGRANSFGDAFNLAGGGVYALLLESSFIRVWHWQNGSVPSDVQSGRPDPSKWNVPTADFDSANGGCEVAQHFRNQTIVIDIDFCGESIDQKTWESDTRCATQQYQSCTSFVAANPDAFSQAYWLFNSIKLYQSA
ncbi:hypothetical protein GQ53DRAFT_786731 [Thozetella sp. PMI_491]|nr:hypothetical protein GQ53DRAFT_786731 [Thozetella sp. PMI_491]